MIFLNNTGGWPKYRKAMARAESYARLFHAAPGTPAVDVYANGNLVTQGFAYGEITEYVTVNPGAYNIQIFPAGRTANPLICSSLAIVSGTSQTIAGVGEPGKLSLFPIKEVYMPVIDRRSAYVRFANLSPDSSSVDIALSDGTVILSDISFMDYSKYITITPGTYTLLMKPMGSNEVLLTITGLNLMAGTINTIFAIGFMDGDPPLEAVTYPDGMY